MPKPRSLAPKQHGTKASTLLAGSGNAKTAPGSKQNWCLSPPRRSGSSRRALTTTGTQAPSSTELQHEERPGKVKPVQALTRSLLGLCVRQSTEGRVGRPARRATGAQGLSTLLSNLSPGYGISQSSKKVQLLGQDHKSPNISSDVREAVAGTLTTTKTLLRVIGITTKPTGMHLVHREPFFLLQGWGSHTEEGSGKCGKSLHLGACLQNLKINRELS